MGLTKAVAKEGGPYFTRTISTGVFATPILSNRWGAAVLTQNVAGCHPPENSTLYASAGPAGSTTQLAPTPFRLGGALGRCRVMVIVRANGEGGTGFYSVSPTRCAGSSFTCAKPCPALAVGGA